MSGRRAVAALAALLVGGGTLVVGLGALSLRLVGPAVPAPVVVSVDAGTRFGDLTRTLVAQGLLRHRWPLQLWARVSGQDRQLQTGDFRFTTALTPLALLARVIGTPDRRHTLTIPEGLTVREVLALLSSAGFGPPERFAALVADPAFLAPLQLPAGAEGYLFPDTYELSLTMPPERILTIMANRFREVYAPLAPRATALGLSEQQVVTLASLVEEEASRPEERALVAAVFLNRLKRGMPMQSDPTVIYGRDTGDRTITRADLARKTPHNTYVNPGLPPTPIANPGRAALEATVNPAPVPYLYFVARGDGSHEFTSDLAAHNAAVARWRR